MSKLETFCKRSGERGGGVRKAGEENEGGIFIFVGVGLYEVYRAIQWCLSTNPLTQHQSCLGVSSSIIISRGEVQGFQRVYIFTEVFPSSREYPFTQLCFLITKSIYINMYNNVSQYQRVFIHPEVFSISRECIFIQESFLITESIHMYAIQKGSRVTESVHLYRKYF